MTTMSSPDKPMREQTFRSRALAREQSPEEEIHDPPVANPWAFVVPWLMCILAWVMGLASLYKFLKQLGSAGSISGG